MHPDDVPHEWMDAVDAALTTGAPLSTVDLRNAISAVATLIAQAEREACANVLDNWRWCPALNDYRATRKAYAAAIRARGT